MGEGLALAKPAAWRGMKNGGRPATPARHSLPSSPWGSEGSVVVARAHAGRGLAHLAGAFAHALGALAKPLGGFEQLLVGHGLAAFAGAGDLALAIVAVLE